MKKLLIIFFLLISIKLSADVYYVATTGNDGNAGTIGSPFLTFQELNDHLTAGDTAYIRGGTYTTYAAQIYQCRWNALNGTVNDTIKIWNYPGETVIWDFTGQNFGSATRYLIQMNQCNYLWVKGIRLTAATQPGTSPIIAWNVINSNNIKIENCTVDHIGGQGFKICDEGWDTGDNNVERSFNLLYLNCDSYANEDPTSPTPFDGADGFGLNHNTNDVSRRNNWAYNVTFRGCRAWFNADDGFDFYGADSTGIVLDNCWSFYNGKSPVDTSLTGNGIGFKLGPNYIDKHLEHQHTVFNCFAVGNRGNGFDQNTMEYSSIHYMWNNFAYNNNEVGFMFGYDQYHGVVEAAHVFRNNASYSNDGGEYDFDAGIIHTNNTWNGAVTVNSSDFVSLTYTQLFGARQSDGSLPAITFGRLAVTSDLIEAGTDVGMTETPDMGLDWAYIDAGAPDPVPVTSITVSGADDATTIETDGGTLQMYATILPIDASIQTVTWSVTNGTGEATISVGGLLTAVADGTITVTATANDGSAVHDDLVITISNQDTSPVYTIKVVFSNGKVHYHNGKTVGHIIE